MAFGVQGAFGSSLLSLLAATRHPERPRFHTGRRNFEWTGAEQKCLVARIGYAMAAITLSANSDVPAFPPTSFVSLSRSR